MNYETFVRSLGDPAPPPQATAALRALWYDARGDMASAERAAGADQGHPTLRVRAYLARKRGDEHAMTHCYWKCGTKPWKGSLESEWDDIVHTVMTQFVVEQAYI